MKFAEALGVRPATPDDVTFVLDTWTHTYRGASFAARIPLDLYRSDFGYQGLVKHLLTVAPTTILHEPGDPTFIIGWGCWSPARLHYLYVRKEFRRKGVATRMLGMIGVPPAPGRLAITHETREFKELARLLPAKPLFVNPFKEVPT